MIPGIFQLAKRSIIFYRKPVLYQIIIIGLLSAVITGSLLTGRSVRTSLKKSASERLGNAGIIISSGQRYFYRSLSDRFRESGEFNATGILEINGFCQSLSSQRKEFNTHIYAIDTDFFKFQRTGNIKISKGEVAVNIKLASQIGVEVGDEIIIRFKGISDIPSDAPFAPANDELKSIVLKVGHLLDPANGGNFSLSISQIIPMNIFINLSDIPDIQSKNEKINRLLIENNNNFSVDYVYQKLKNILRLSDVGFTLRDINKTKQTELISDRVFIDETIIEEINNLIPPSAPVITYLGNRFSAGSRFTPYSFISALPSSLYPDIAQGDSIIINKWLAEDLNATKGSSIVLYWYSPDSLNKLIEKSNQFIVSRIIDLQGIWADSLLMPDFPGIAGSASCSRWDAGFPIKMNDIRRKDENYWNKYKGTPKAFISYDKGKEIWGNNFGPATAIRFPTDISQKEIEDKINGSLSPDKTGFIISDIYGDSIKAANESVDFSTLFISLGFFLILASVVLLSFAATFFFSTKERQIKTLYALGFNHKWIKKLILLESGLIVFTGSALGVLAGNLVNILITKALNSVWRGAVQTDTLESYFNIMPMLSGFLITFIFTMALMLIMLSRYLKKLNLKDIKPSRLHPARRNLLYLIISSFVTLALYVYQLFNKEQEIALFFGAGTFLLISQILFWQHFFIGRAGHQSNKIHSVKSISRLYYSFYPSHAVTPVLLIAAGIFAVFITGANRMNFSGQQMKRSGGTGGYLLWCENRIPVKEDLNSDIGKKAFGLDDEQLKKMDFVQVKKSSGDDASCLNLNHVSAPPLLGIDPSEFISRESFSFSKKISVKSSENPWLFLNVPSETNTIYGIADQTVLEWGLKIKPGDTLILRAENGQPLRIIIAAGLKSSVFQGYVIIGKENFIRYYPSVSGSSVFLVDGDPELTDLYKNTLAERFDNYGINIEQTGDRLAAFYEVTNTYLSVFLVFGALGMITGIIGLGFILLRNYNFRKREFALMLATGFTLRNIRRIILSEQVLVLFAGMTAGVSSAIVATLPSVRNSLDIPWLTLIVMVSAILVTGLSTLIYSTRSVTNTSLKESLKKE